MDFPKKFIRTYQEGEEPVKIIKGSGNPPCIKIVEYAVVKRTGTTVVYKK